jgi:hypothetical protein
MGTESSFADGLESGCSKSKLNSLTHCISLRMAGLLECEGLMRDEDNLQNVLAKNHIPNART